MVGGVCACFCDLALFYISSEGWRLSVTEIVLVFWVERRG